MRKVKYGRFVDFMPPTYDYDSGLIGAHRYVGNAEKESLKTAGYEYYVEQEGKRTVITNATFVERAVARVGFALNPKKKRVLGERKFDEPNPYDTANPQLGVRLDEKGRKVVDEDYYRDAEQRSLDKGDRKAADAVYKKRIETEQALAEEQQSSSDELSKMLEESVDTPITESKSNVK